MTTYLHGFGLELTLAGFHALRPPVINIFVADTSAVLIPSTARSAATDSAGLRERDTLCTRHSLSDR